MTVSTTATKVSSPTNGSATIYSYSPLVLFADTELEVTLVLDSSGAETVIPKGTGSAAYAIVVTGDYPQTGSIRYPEDEVTPQPSGYTIVMKRVLAILQPTDLAKQGGYFADTQENQFDRLVMIDLQQQDLIDRALKIPVGSSGIATDLPVPVAGQFLLWNAAGDAITSSANILGTAIGGSATPEDVNITGGVVGVATDFAREDHEHLLPTGTSILNYLLAAGTAIANVFTKTQTWHKGADVESATALLINVDGNYHDVTGAVTVTSLAAVGVGTTKKLHFDGAVLLTHHATNLILPSGANITTAAGDEFEFTEYAAGDWRCTGYVLASGFAVRPARIAGGEEKASTSGTVVDFTGIPAGVKEINVMFEVVSHDGTEELLIQLGDAGGFETTGYNSGAGSGATFGQDTTGFVLTTAGGATETYTGVITLRLKDAANFSWLSSGNMMRGVGDRFYASAGAKDLSAVLTQLRITTTGTPDTFDLGSIAISYDY